mgnify:CR=1 FL=1
MLDDWTCHGFIMRDSSFETGPYLPELAIVPGLLIGVAHVSNEAAAVTLFTAAIWLSVEVAEKGATLARALGLGAVALVLVEVTIIGKALDFLPDEVAIGHGVADGGHFESHLSQDE